MSAVTENVRGSHSRRGGPGAGALRQLWAAYRHCTPPRRIRVLARYLSCPYDRLVSLVPPAGRILDVGCGDGLLLWLLSRSALDRARLLTGLDPAPARVAVAATSVPSAEFRLGSAADAAPAAYDCVCVVDVLYLLPTSEWPAFLGHCVRALKPRGLFLVKEVQSSPPWKRRLTLAQEILALRVLGLTQGGAPHFESAETYRASIEAAGAEVVEIERLDAWRPHAHVLLVARKR